MHQKLHQFIKFIFIRLLFLTTSPYISAQDTLLTTYPNSDQRWEKIYTQNEKIAENIYHKNGTEWMTVQYQPGEVQQWKWYYDNGQPYFEATIVNDLLQGSYKIWYENGQLAEHLFFRNSIENGQALFYYPNGKIAMEGDYQNGKMTGQWTFYDEHGKTPTGAWNWPFAASTDELRFRGQFKDGQPSGKWVYKGTANMGKATQLIFEREY